MKSSLRILSYGLLSTSLVCGMTGKAAKAEGPVVSEMTGATSTEIAARVGMIRPSGVNPTEFSKQVAKMAGEGAVSLPPTAGTQSPAANMPLTMNYRAPFSAGVLTTIGGQGSQFEELLMLGDWDGREDLTADHGGKVDDFSLKVPQPAMGWMLTRCAVSEHTVANGFKENIFYSGDSYGNVYVSTSSTLSGALPPENVFVINLPTVLNAFGTLMSDDQIVVTGLAVNPVADLTSFANVNGSYSPFTNKIGEILYVAFWDTGGGLRLATNGVLVRSGILAFPVSDEASPAPMPPGVLTPLLFPVTVGGAFGVAYSVYSNLAGCAVDDDGSVYFQQVDLIQFTGGNIVKIASTDKPAPSGWQDRSMATNGIMTLTTLNATAYGNTSGPTKQVNRFTNYSGTSSVFGNITALAAGPNNVLYAAMARSFVSADDARTQDTEGVFANPAALGPTPSMIISFADVAGGFDTETIPPPAFLPCVPYNAGMTASGIASADFNSDHYPDLAVTSYSDKTVSVLMNLRNGTFAPPVTYAVGSGPLSIVAANLGGDSSADLAVANSTSNNVSILINNGDGTFQPAVNYGVGTTPKDLTIGHFNADDYYDIATANFTSNNVSILINAGNGTFNPAANYSVGTNPNGITTGQFNLDGTYDLAVTKATLPAKVSILLGNGDGSFLPPVSYNVSDGAQGVVSGYFNADGAKDLAVACTDSGVIAVLMGNGDGTFVAAVNYDAGATPTRITTADVDNTNGSDLVFCNSSTSRMTILLNNGSGVFSGAYPFPTDSIPVVPVAGDFNMDGRIDIANTSYGAGKADVFIARGGVIPVPDGYADVLKAGQTLVPGLNNYRAFVLGDGPDRRDAGSEMFGSTTETLKLEMQTDYTVFSGLTADEAGQVYVISGGTPAGVGLDPSPRIGEILTFPDCCPANRRADFIDLRGDKPPNPPLSGGNTGDGDSDRYDHIFYQAPLDQMSVTPTGLSGLSRGFMMYLNRARNDPAAFPTLPNGRTQVDDEFNGPVQFHSFDVTEQVAGGDDSGYYTKGDDSNTTGGFEFVFGGVLLGGCKNFWDDFYLNANGNITFSAGSVDHSPTESEFRSGLPMIAPAWADYYPGSRVVESATFPVQSLGFAGVNVFKVRWMNVPIYGQQTLGSSNSFSASLYDDGVITDENATWLLEGPTDYRWKYEPVSGLIVPYYERPNNTGFMRFDYGYMSVAGSSSQPVLVGYSVGGQSGTVPPGLCGINLSEAALAADNDIFRPCLIGEGTEPEIHQFFNHGTAGDYQTSAVFDLDLRWEGNDPVLATPISRTADANLNRGNICLYGAACTQPEPALTYSITTTPPVVVAPGQPQVQTSTTLYMVNLLRTAQINNVGSYFSPNESTTICQGIAGERPGKTVSTQMGLRIDANNDGMPDTDLLMSSVTPQSGNLVNGMLAPLPSAPGTPFPLTWLGGYCELVTTTTYSSGNNNIFGPFQQVSTVPVDVKTRAPVVQGCSPASGDAAVTQTLTLFGQCMQFPSGASNVVRVYAQELGNPYRIVIASQFHVFNAQSLEATFYFGPENRGRRFLIFAASGVGGCSRNLEYLPYGTPAGCPLGNEAGNQILFACNPAANFAVAQDDFFTTGDPSSSGLDGWLFTAGYGGMGGYIAAPGALTVTISSEAGKFRAGSWQANFNEWLPYAFVGTDKVVRGKFYMYASGQTPTGQKNLIPNMRLRLGCRFAINAMLEVLHTNNSANPLVDQTSQEFAPSQLPMLPSLYRVDMVPVDVPIMNNGYEGVMRSFDLYGDRPQFQGTIAMTESVIGTYARALIPLSVPPSKTYTPVDLLTYYAPDSQRLLYIPGVSPGDFPTLDTTSPPSDYPTITEDGGAGITLDCASVPTNRIGAAVRDFNPPQDYSDIPSLVRVIENKQYGIRWHLTSTRQTNEQSQIRMRGRSIGFSWSQKLEIGGAWAAGSASNQLAQQLLPCIGCLNPDQITPGENGGWYTMIIHTPMSMDIRPDVPGTTIADKMPLINALPGPGSALFAGGRDRALRFGIDVIDTLSGGTFKDLERGNVLMDHLELRVYELIAD